MESPIDVLNSHNARLEPRIPLNRFISFGMKVIVKSVNNQSKIHNRGESLRALTFEKYSDGLRVLDLKNGQTRISRGQKGHHYILVIIDDCSRFNRIFPMIKKFEAEKNVEFYLNEIKNKLNISPAFLHSDRGGEFSSTSFINKLKTLGICFEQGPPNSPETNGVAEHFNQSLLSKIRCLLSQSNIPIGYWDEAF
ncbi:hypothetical protein O181_000843 [Austropuccinia psidii MF-1]|uniref:Integrase catalytic domain-containing protein n=1 Tax=Austropuccinia psidii MF-1 TaxID=1389203 RepID=A0A9Q3B9L1_9BASI|nr:hypothetical protein [Austropuccinia psidii MF-1]